MEEKNELGTPDSPKSSKRVPILLGCVIVALIVVGAYIYVNRDTTDQAAVDQAVTELQAATEVSTANQDLLASSRELSPKTAPKVKADVSAAAIDLSNIELPPEGSQALTEAIKDSTLASERLLRAAQALLRSEKLRQASTKEDAGRLQQASAKLISRVNDLAISKLLSSSSASLRSAIDEAAATLEGEDALSDQNQQQIDQTVSNLDEITVDVDAIDKVVASTFKDQAKELGKKRYDVLKVTGTADCGDDENGSAVIVNVGSITCERAIRLTRNLASGFVPAPGWICDITAETIDHSTLPGSNGSFCASDAEGIKISVYNRAEAESYLQSIAAPPPSDSSPSSQCGPEEQWVQSYGVPNSGRCVVKEGDESEG